MSEPFLVLTSGIVVLAQENIDTDQIVPARFMATVTAQGLGDALFSDARSAAHGTHPLDAAEPEAQRILVAGANFGCGSSREHAVWALIEFGFRAVLAPGIADIFNSNALNSGLLAIDIAPSFHAHLVAHPDSQVNIDLERQSVSDGRGREETFRIDPFARFCLLRGMDRLEVLLSKRNRIVGYEQARFFQWS
nr:3-isopropylmalate dehydratase small subunit [uncultured Duganella sp.]